MEKTSITPYQLFCFMVLAGIGSSSVLGVGGGAKQDAWITSLLGMSGGLIILLFYYYISKQNPDLNYFQIIEGLFGKFIAKGMSVLYLTHFILIATLVERDIGEMIKLYVLPATPMYLTQLIGLAIIGYAVYLGVEVMARFAEISFSFTIFTLIGSFLLAIGAGIVNIENLLPVLENGWTPVLKTTFPLTITFPYSELFVFVMIFPHVNKKSKILSRALLAYILVGAILTTIDLLNVTVLGPYLAEKTLFPTLATARLIDIGDAVQRVDVIAVVLLMVGGGAKVAAHLYAACIIVDYLFETKSHTRYIIPNILAINFLTFILTDNLTRHMDFGITFVPIYLNLPLEIIIPILLTIFIFIRNRIIGYKQMNKVRIN